MSTPFDREHLEDRLARVTPLTLVLRLAVPTAMCVFFLITHVLAGRVVWVVVWALLLVIDASVCVWWAVVRIDRRRDAEAFADLSCRPKRR
jgi:hypothetical protein